MLVCALSACGGARDANPDLRATHTLLNTSLQRHSRLAEHPLEAPHHDLRATHALLHTSLQLHIGIFFTKADNRAKVRNNAMQSLLFII